MYNNTVLVGRITKALEMKTTTNGVNVLSFTLAINKKVKEKDQVSYISCVSFNKTAEILNQYCDKGSLILVDGELQSRSYEKDNRTIYVTEVVVGRVVLLDNKQKSANIEVEPKPSPRSVALNKPKSDYEKRQEEVKELLGDINESDLPF
jgi:single-strand DNA-binding protein